MSQEIATLAGGCFWCLEAVYLDLRGVEKVVSGYAGGHIANPTYREVCSGLTGHAEVVEVTFDPAALPYRALLAWFFRLHDPTTLNRQGADQGTQYRSVIFWHSEAQQTTARETIDALTEASAFPNRIVTELAPASTFFPAEGEHQDYYRRNRSNPYCQRVIAPKLGKLGLQR